MRDELADDVEAEIKEGQAIVIRSPRLIDVLNAVCAVYRVGKLDMMSLRRLQNLVDARDAFYWTARHATPRTYVEIGRFLADRDHSTVFAGVKRCAKRFDVHQQRLQEVWQKLEMTLSVERLK